MASLSVCIFAHNEARLLPRCIRALGAAAPDGRFKAHILVNGATDDTLMVAKTLAAVDTRLVIHELPIADKANAWNEYVHRIADASAVHIFLDGDIAPSPGAFDALASALASQPEALGAAALPASGRSRRAWATRLYLNRYLSGNLYALSRSAIDSFRTHRIRLPFGAKGEDGLITYLLLTDLKGGADDSHANRIVVARDATFEFDSLSATWRDLKIYHRRLKRYSERYFQKEVLYRLLKREGVVAMPDNIYDIYTPEALEALRPRLDPVNFIYDWATLRWLRQRHPLAMTARA